MRKLPLKLPSAYVLNSNAVAPTQDVNTGSYDILLGGFGFRLATDTNNPYSRATEPTTTTRFDASLEPGEQSLSPLPWIKSQSSFHAGAGQLNLEQGFTAFQYQQEQVEHIRFDGCLGVNIWTPGQLTRLPDSHYYNLVGSSTCAAFGGTSILGDCGVFGGVHTLEVLAWASGPDATPTSTAVDLSSALLGGASNCTITSLATDGRAYYALVQLTANGSVAGVRTYIVQGTHGINTAPAIWYAGPADSKNHLGTLGWSKARLVAGIDNNFYELDPPTTLPQALPTPKYTHPAPTWSWTAISESPTAILGAGTTGGQASVLAFELDSTGAVPTLAGGSTIAVLPAGELIYDMEASLGSFLALGTQQGVRVGSFDTYTGALTYGPLSITTPGAVQALASRDRFIYGGYTNGQEDGHTGLVRLDLSMTVDAAGRIAYAPDLRPPTTAPTGLGAVTAVGLLPQSLRMVYLTPEGLHVEGPGPGSDGVSYLRTSRIRYDTAELKLFKFGRIHGTLDSSEIQVIGIAPFQSDQDLGTFGFIVGGDPGEFALPANLTEWIQLKFILSNNATFNSYQCRAYPAPKRQHIIQLAANCFASETDRNGQTIIDAQLPRQRYQNVLDLEASGVEARFVEFTSQGTTAVENVIIDQLIFQSTSPPTTTNDFGGIIQMKLRATDG